MASKDVGTYESRGKLHQRAENLEKDSEKEDIRIQLTVELVIYFGIASLLYDSDRVDALM